MGWKGVLRGQSHLCRDREISVARTSRWPGNRLVVGIMGTSRLYFSLQDSACLGCVLSVSVRQPFRTTSLTER